MSVFESLSSIPLEKRWRQQANPMPIVAAIIQRDNEVNLSEGSQSFYLLIKRKSQPYAGLWALVGGKWDFGETLVQTISREVQEETGLESILVTLRGVVNEQLAPEKAINNPASHFIIFVCQVVVSGGPAMEQDEGAVAWFTQSEIEEFNSDGRIIPSDYRMIRDFIGANSIPYVEAEMFTLRGEETGISKPQLARFDHVI